jgi:hypothetical protein
LLLRLAAQKPSWGYWSAAVTDAEACAVTADGFPGGQISMDIGALGADGDFTAELLVNNSLVCSVTRPVSEPATSWNCSTSRSGNVHLQAGRFGVLREYHLGLRW